jgi:outer membrane protein assembly factor BamB
MRVLESRVTNRGILTGWSILYACVGGAIVASSVRCAPDAPPQQVQPAKKKPAAAVAAAAVPVPVTGAGIEVDPSPPGPESWATFRNGPRQLGVAKTSLPEKPEVVWQFKTSDGVLACAAIVGDQVYVPCLNGQLLSVDRRTGKTQWSYRSVADPKEFAWGFKAAPTVTADTVYIGDEEGSMHAIDRRTGKQKWKPFKAGDEIAGAAALFEDKIIFGSHDSFLYCLTASDGTLNGGWKFQTENRVNCATAIEGDKTFIAGCDTKVRVIDVHKGKEVGEVPLGEGAYLIASPAVLGDMLYVGTHDGRVVGVDWAKQKVAWTYTDPKRPMEFRSSAAVTEEFVILGGYDKQLHCLDRKSGRQVWTFYTRSHIESSPVVVGDRVFVGSGDGNLYAVTLKEGKKVWEFRAGRSLTASPAVGEKCLVIGTEGPNGTVFCFGAK